MDIVTSLCVDDARHPASYYDQLQDVNADGRRRTYWQCVLVLFGSSVRCNPATQHVLYTNDLAPARWQGFDYQQVLRDLGVAVRQLPFEQFQPPANASRKFRNGFYKLEVMRELAGAAAGDYSLLLDSDCVWSRPEPQLGQALRSGRPLLFDISSAPDTKIIDLSRRDMGRLYREIFPDYPTETPRHFGGELVGGSRACFAALTQELSGIWQHLLAQYPAEPPRFGNQESLFDGDEYVTSLAYNRLPGGWTDASPFIRRIWTAFRYSDARPTDLHLPIWHLPGEKLQGLAALSRQVLQPRSGFWQVPLPELGRYLGRYLGVPPRPWQPQRLLALAHRLPTALRLTRRLLAQ